MDATQLKDNRLWWKGPEWLTSSSYPLTRHKHQTDLDLKKVKVLTARTSVSTIMELTGRFSSFQKLLRVVAYCKRFIQNCQAKKGKQTTYINGYLTSNEINNARFIVLQQIQQSEFAEDISKIKSKNRPSKKSELKSLNPFLDEKGLVRVGGRIENSTLPYNQKHPILLPRNNKITTLIIEDAHHKTLHGGIQLTHTYLRRQYWIIKGRRTIQQMIQNCVTCHRYNAKAQQQLMGNLPSPRVTPSRPFSNTGIDYAGPISIRLSKGRGTKSYKGYIALFICLATKAIHLEVVSDMTTNAFMAAFKRFTARRGLCSNIYSDNGTTFVGARSVIERNLSEAISKTTQQIAEFIALEGVTWHFIPPAAPNFGGLWEAGVKSTKYHLKRIIGETILTFEELTTILSQIEACLNSRPLCPLSEDPNDLDYLTPGHFLIGQPLVAPPEPQLADDIPLHTRWNLCQKISEDFWNSWSKEYLTRLQQRPKWLDKTTNLQIGDLVLLRDDQLPPSKWALGRVSETHPGSDGIVRVVTIKAKGNALIKRPINKISKLPVTSTNCEEPKPLAQSTNQIQTLLTKRSGSSNPNQHKRARLIAPLKEDPREVDLPGKPTARSWLRGQNIESIQKMATHLKDRISISTPSKVKIRPYISPPLWALTIFMCAQLSYIRASTQPYQVQPIDNNPGLYFRELGDLRRSESDWQIIVYVNMSNYWNRLNNYRSSIKRLQEISPENGELPLLRARLEQVEENNHLLEHHSNRQRRGAPLSFVGNLMGDLFGVMDESSANEVRQKIELISDNQHNMYALLKNQTSILSSTINIIRNQELEHLAHWKALNTQLEYLDARISELSLHFSLTSYSLLLITDFQRMQDILINTIIDIHRGATNPNLLSPSQLKTEMAKIRQHLPDDVSLPVTDSPSDLITAYQIMSCKYRFFEDLAIFTYKLPLTKPAKYSLYNIIPLPITTFNQTTYIKPKGENIVVNSHQDQYFFLNNNEVEACLQPHQGHYICKTAHSIQQKTNDCEINILQSQQPQMDTCDLRPYSTPNTWIRLEPNTWLYTSFTVTTLSILCADNRFVVHINTTSILKLAHECTAKDDSTEFSTQQEVVTKLNGILFPDINIIMNTAPPLTTAVSIRPQLQDIEELSTKLQTIDRELDYAPPLSHHDIHHYTVSYLTMGVIIALLLVYCYYKPSPQRSALERPIPAPRTSLV